MHDPRGPWSQNPPTQRSRAYVVVGALVAVGVLIWFLMREFPDVVHTSADELRLAYFASVLVLLSSGLVLSRRFTIKDSLRNISIWIGVAAVLSVAFL